jgi:hypothetical protein
MKKVNFLRFILLKFLQFEHEQKVSFNAWFTWTVQKFIVQFAYAQLILIHCRIIFLWMHEFNIQSLIHLRHVNGKNNYMCV